MIGTEIMLSPLNGCLCSQYLLAEKCPPPQKKMAKSTGIEASKFQCLGILHWYVVISYQGTLLNVPMSRLIDTALTDLTPWKMLPEAVCTVLVIHISH